MKNILCFEGEWKFNTHKKPERFDLNSEPILRMLKEYHKCDAIYRHILTKEDLKLYIELSMLISKCFDHYFQFMLRFYIQG